MKALSVVKTEDDSFGDVSLTAFNGRRFYYFKLFYEGDVICRSVMFVLFGIQIY